MSAVANAPSNTDAKPTDVERYPGELRRIASNPEMWEDRWVTGSTFWDKGSSHEFLVEFLGSKESDEAGIPREGRAFVPGCGQVSCVNVLTHTRVTILSSSPAVDWTPPA